MHTICAYTREGGPHGLSTSRQPEVRPILWRSLFKGSYEAPMDTIKVVAYAQATPATGMPCPTRRSRTFSGVEIDLDGGVTARVEDLRIHKSVIGAGCTSERQGIPGERGLW